MSSISVCPDCNIETFLDHYRCHGCQEHFHFLCRKSSRVNVRLRYYESIGERNVCLVCREEGL